MYLGLTQLAYFFCRVRDAASIFERSNKTFNVTHQPPTVTVGFSPGIYSASKSFMQICRGSAPVPTPDQAGQPRGIAPTRITQMI
jgi:hypothetical protein